MNEQDKSVDKLLSDLKERAKELNCLYEVEELMMRPNITLEELFKGLIRVIPSGWQYPEICQVKITYRDSVYQSKDLKETPWVLKAAISFQIEVVGMIHVFYTREMPGADEGPFLKEERRLINSIADRVSHFLKLHHAVETQETKPQSKAEWRVILDLLRRTDQKLLIRISRKMTNYLCWSGIPEAERLLEYFMPSYKNGDNEQEIDLNRPHQKKALDEYLFMIEDIFNIAAENLKDEEILEIIQKWIKEDKSGFLVNILENPGSSLATITEAIERYHHLAPQGIALSLPREKSFRVSLIRRLLVDQPQFINIAKHYIDVDDFYDLLHRIIYPPGSHGKLGGKSSNLFLATRILEKSSAEVESLKNILTPKTWYLTSDGLLNFMHYNNLEDVVEQKYKDLGQVRQEYPYVVQVFKNSPMPPETVKSLSVALDDFGEKPLIVRSSSLLEDRMGTAFAGKYKSLFIANQGTKEERLIALIDAIAEVYASTFGPDPIEYRVERGLVDFHEEMGILIQEVVGQKVGHYYLPAYAGVAFSNNEFRWSSRIRREDGLLRLVPGLGTRAVDRLSDDYPILIAPGHPGLRVNATLDEKIRYSPKKVDVINLKTNTFETIDFQSLVREYGHEYSSLTQTVSILEHNHIRQPSGLGIDFEKDNLLVSFEGLLQRTSFVDKIHTILTTLQEKLATPVDIEFASDGKDFYLLQCRPQSYGEDSLPAVIPADVPEERIVFTAQKYISNGTIANISYLVYVDPQKYSELENRQDMLEVGRAISKLNEVLPRRKFILMGPGRWGSRGDIKLGVSVTYSDINNTAMLIEIARKKGNYVPDVSFGTHFFQDLAESSIRYLPLYPDDEDIIFNEVYLTQSVNLLSSIIPDYANLSGTIKVIDVRQGEGNLFLQVRMNADREMAVGFLAEQADYVQPVSSRVAPFLKKDRQIDHSQWRTQMAEKLALRLNGRRFGVKELYLIDNTPGGAVLPESKIELLIHFQGTEEQRSAILTWLEGWSLCLSEMNFTRTGVKTAGLLEVHIVTDEDIRKHSPIAARIKADANPACRLPLGED